MERRFLPNDECPVSIEKRDDGEQKIVGRAAVFYDGTEETEFKLFDAVTNERGDIVIPAVHERVNKRAFNKVLKERQDVRGLFNHDPNYVLGRTSAGTLKLEKSLRGLDYTITPGKTTVANDVREHIARGDVDGSSFSFTVTEQKWLHDDERNIDIREIVVVGELYDVGPVTFPAYKSTDVGVRAEGNIEELRSAHQAWRASLGEQANKAAALKERLDSYKQRAGEVEC